MADLGSVAGGAGERGRGSHVDPGDPEGCLEEWAMTWALGDEESTVLPIDVAIVAESPPPQPVLSKDRVDLKGKGC